jgi:hypothetical protein
MYGATFAHDDATVDPRTPCYELGVDPSSGARTIERSREGAGVPLRAGIGETRS